MSLTAPNAPSSVGYTGQTAARVQALTAAQQQTLGAAVDILAASPLHAESWAVSSDGSTRRVRASQSLTLTYRTNGTRLLVIGVTELPPSPAPRWKRVAAHRTLLFSRSAPVAAGDSTER